ncbi:diphthine--ammonia ligase [Candidatus Woesearchaeota archaeon]|nr:MAG: diphthine--ammonia ligase [Candidatus Woesearchaeota archaeon]
MKLGVLCSGGKDSLLAAYLAHKEGYTLSCLITLSSANEASYMFHTPSITKVAKQAQSMNLPLILQNTRGEKETELEDLKEAIKKAKEEFGIEGVVTGAVESVYQASRIQNICNELNLECFNPLWQKDQLELLEDLLRFGFKVIITGVAAYPLDETWLGREINSTFIKEVRDLQEKFHINPAGEGGEFESFVLYCPLFKEPLEIKDKKIFGSGNSWRMEVDL